MSGAIAFGGQLFRRVPVSQGAEGARHQSSAAFVELGLQSRGLRRGAKEIEMSYSNCLSLARRHLDGYLKPLDVYAIGPRAWPQLAVFFYHSAPSGNLLPVSKNSQRFRFPLPMAPLVVGR